MKNRLFEIRTENGLSQEKFAKQVGVAKVTIVNAELGRKPLKERQIISICNRFGIQYEWLLYGTGEKYKINPLSQKALNVLGKLSPEMQDIAISILENLEKAQEVSNK